MYFQIMVRHLREQLALAEVEREKHASLRVRELALETHINRLQDELHEAKTYHTPVSITFTSPPSLSISFTSIYKFKKVT